MVQKFLKPQLLQDGVLDAVAFQLDWSPCRYARIAQEYLNLFRIGGLGAEELILGGAFSRFNPIRLFLHVAS
jgi:hypothetical protein